MLATMKAYRFATKILSVAICSLGGWAYAEELESPATLDDEGLKLVGDMPKNWVVVRDLDSPSVEQIVELTDGSKRSVSVPRVILQSAQKSSPKGVDSGVKFEKAISLQSKHLVNAEVQMESVLSNLRSLLNRAEKAK